MKNDEREIFYPIKGMIWPIVLAVGVVAINMFRISRITDSLPGIAGGGAVYLGFILRNTRWLIIDSEKFTIKGLFDKEVVHWENIKQVVNDYPRIELAQFTMRELEAAAEKSKLEGTTLNRKDWAVHSFNLKILSNSQRIMELVKKYATNARIDSGIDILTDKSA